MYESEPGQSASLTNPLDWAKSKLSKTCTKKLLAQVSQYSCVQVLSDKFIHSIQVLPNLSIENEEVIFNLFFSVQIQWIC